MLTPRRVLLVMPDMLNCWFVGRLGRCGCVEEWLVSWWEKTGLTPCGYILGSMTNHLITEDPIRLASDLTTQFFSSAMSNPRQSWGYTAHITPICQHPSTLDPTLPRPLSHWVQQLFLNMTHTPYCSLCFIHTSRIAHFIWFHLFIKAVCPTRSFTPWPILWCQLIHFSHSPTRLCL